MFTGLVEALGTVYAIHERSDGREITIAQADLAPGLTAGESVAVNGTCLTVISIRGDEFGFQLVPETLRCTNLGDLAVGDRVNLERAVAVGDRLGGHIVQGHVDGLGRLAKRERQGDWETIWIDCPADLLAQMVPKGSVAVDGVSLTIVEVTPTDFSVALIPHTLEMTTLGWKQPPATVNLETDILAKYVSKYLHDAHLAHLPGGK